MPPAESMAHSNNVIPKFRLWFMFSFSAPKSYRVEAERRAHYDAVPAKLTGIGISRCGYPAPANPESPRLHDFLRGRGSKWKMRAAFSPRMLRLACSDRNGRS